MGLFLDSGLRKLLHPYYLTNILLSLSFLICKMTYPLCSWAFDACELNYRESEILLFTGVIILFRTRKQGAVSLLPYISTACMFAKLGSLILFSYSDPVYGLLFAAAALLHLLLLPEPVYQGPENVTYFRPDDMEQLIKSRKETYWLIELYAAWNPTSVEFASVFSELSAKYSLENLRFGKVDISKSPKLASKYKINTSFMSKQLPTLILFLDGVEQMRRPVVAENGRLVKFAFNFENVVSAFDLNNLYEGCKNSISKKGKKQQPQQTPAEKKTA